MNCPHSHKQRTQKVKACQRDSDIDIKQSKKILCSPHSKLIVGLKMVDFYHIRKQNDIDILVMNVFYHFILLLLDFFLLKNYWWLFFDLSSCYCTMISVVCIQFDQNVVLIFIVQHTFNHVILVRRKKKSFHLLVYDLQFSCKYSTSSGFIISIFFFSQLTTMFFYVIFSR